MNTFKLSALALVLSASLFSVSANADVIVHGPDSDPLAIGENYIFNNPSVDTPSFNDWVQVDVMGPRFFSASISAASNIDVSFTAFDLYAADQTTLVASGSFGNFGPTIAYGGLTSNTSLATYWLNIAGNAIPTTTYTGNIALSALPVPEPETYSMMLAGLGLMGFVARRRKI